MMGKFKVLLGIAILLSLPLAAQSPEPGRVLELNEILTPGEQGQYQRKPDYRNRAILFRDVLRRLGEQISKQTRTKDYEGIDRSLKALRATAIHGIEQTRAKHTQKEARSRKVKRLEIELRRLIEDLDDLKQRVHFELRLQYEDVQKQLEEYRQAVLALVFENEAGNRRQGVSGMRDGWAGTASLLPASLVAPQRRRNDSGIRGDQFTDEEYGKVQDAQQLMDRVKIFVEIAESRLKEIERRSENLEWKGDKDNPLEFYTLAQMVHAYDRSIQGIMIFIDEKATRHLASEKEIKKALTLLNKRMQDFIPKLEPIRQRAIDTKDQELFIEIRSAMKNSEAALKGSQLGLGVPANNH